MSLEIFHSFLCPYCSQPNELLIDITGGEYQSLIVDCEVCCSPIVAQVTLDGDQLQNISIDRETI